MNSEGNKERKINIEIKWINKYGKRTMK